MKVETKCLHAGYEPKNGEPRALPIYQSTTYKYDSTEFVGQLFDLTAEGHMYSRISNPTVDAVEKKIAALEGGAGAHQGGGAGHLGAPLLPHLRLSFQHHAPGGHERLCGLGHCRVQPDQVRLALGTVGADRFSDPILLSG